ncbi:MAG TPA: OmpW family outer membrane protein [Thermoanaerobaculia bacterium]|nr:OmpW family outer membrane protein [Thermoanaerobaculia bacterium]
MLRRRPAVPPLLLLAALVASSSAVAHGQDSRWSLGVDGLYLAADDGRAAVGAAAGAPAGATYGIDGDGVGFGLALGYRATRRFGVELELATVDLDVAVPSATPGAARADTESASFELYLMEFRWHLVPERRFDLTLGALVAMTKLADVRFPTAAGGSAKLTFDDDVGFGLALGVDWPLGGDGGWLLRGRLRYLRTILESDSGAQDLDLDPLLLSVGVGYRF